MSLIPKGRKPSPWYRRSRHDWVVSLRGKIHVLGRIAHDEPPPIKVDGKWIVPDAIQQAFETLLRAVPPKLPEGLSVADVFEKYTAWCQKYRSPRTHYLAMKHTADFSTSLPKPAVLMPASMIRPYHVVEWIDSHDTWGPNQKRAAISSVQRAFNWAANLGYPGVVHLRGVERPEPKKRDSKLGVDEYKALMNAVRPDDPFRDLLVFSWEVGCRPQETRDIEASHLNLRHHRIEIPAEEAKGKRRWRVIYLSPTAEAIVVRLLEKNSEGKLFRNTRGVPWTVWSIGNRFGRLQQKLSKRFAAYDFRHAFATRKLKEGVDPITVATLLGHKDAAMLCRFYEGISGDGEHLAEVLKSSPPAVQPDAPAPGKE